MSRFEPSGCQSTSFCGADKLCTMIHTCNVRPLLLHPAAALLECACHRDGCMFGGYQAHRAPLSTFVHLR